MKNEVLQITILGTGGTIEKKYDEISGVLVNRESLVCDSILKNLRLPYLNWTFRSILSKDSLEFSSQDREFIVRNIQSELDRGQRVIILHGTDTMQASAEFCRQKLKNLSAPVIFTGAMKPLGFLDSDAYQNIVSSLMGISMASPGVYISFHNKIFKVPGVRKNPQKRTFEEY